ncbi:hypothetical protein RB594_001649 [Gaeumannomyces avenae]
MASSDSDLMVTLTDTSKSATNAQRLIRVTRQNPIIRFGRASKTQAKGRVAADNNALYDSPVMSREHAELIADVDAKTLAVLDVGSTHGTFLNGSDHPITKNTEHAVKTGDKIRFGIAINRDRDAFTPITVELGYEFTSRCGPVTFQVPDDSADEDAQADHIDLTQEEDADIVDLTSEVACSPSLSKHIDQAAPSPSRERFAAPSESTDDQVSGFTSGLETRPSIIEGALNGEIGSAVSNTISPAHEEIGCPTVLSDEEADAVYGEVGKQTGDSGLDSELEIDTDMDADMEVDMEVDMEAEMDSEMASSDDEDYSDQESSEGDSGSGDSGSDINDLYAWDEDSHNDNSESVEDMIGVGVWPYSPLFQTTSSNPLAVETRCPAATPFQVEPPYVEVGIPSAIALRAPSPSDAALIRRPMVAPAPALAPVTAPAPVPAPVHTHEEFLAARQDNKEKLINTNRQIPGPIISQSLVGQLEPLPLLTQPAGPFSALLNDESVNSAFTYEKKKQDVSATGLKEQPRVSPKRKAAEISEASNKELDEMGCGGPKEHQDSHSAQANPAPPQAPSLDQALTLPVLEQSNVSLDEPRPIKRLRRFASSVGIAAIGGITVGAVVFGSLAATCPAF